MNMYLYILFVILLSALFSWDLTFSDITKSKGHKAYLREAISIKYIARPITQIIHWIYELQDCILLFGVMISFCVSFNVVLNSVMQLIFFSFLLTWAFYGIIHASIRRNLISYRLIRDK